MDTPPHASLELVGRAGRLVVTDPWPVPARVTIDGREIAMPEPNPDPFVVELEEFRDAVREGRPPRLGRDDAVAQARVLKALARAMETTAVVDLTAR